MHCSVIDTILFNLLKKKATNLVKNIYGQLNTIHLPKTDRKQSKAERSQEKLCVDKIAMEFD